MLLLSLLHVSQDSFKIFYELQCFLMHAGTVIVCIKHKNKIIISNVLNKWKWQITKYLVGTKKNWKYQIIEIYRKKTKHGYNQITMTTWLLTCNCSIRCQYMLSLSLLHMSWDSFKNICEFNVLSYRYSHCFYKTQEWDQ